MAEDMGVMLIAAEHQLAQAVLRELRETGHDPRLVTSSRAVQDILQTEIEAVLFTSDLHLVRVAASLEAKAVFLSRSAEHSKAALLAGAAEVLTFPFAPGGCARILSDISATKGFIHQLNLVDLLQVMHMGMRSVTISVSPGNGRIFMERGQIVHAERKGRAGLDALRVILSREPSSIETGPEMNVPTTIHAPFEVLLLDLMREIDEAQREGRSLGGDTGDIVLSDARPSLPPPSKPVELAVELPVEESLRRKRSSAWPVLLTVPLAIAAFYLASEPPVRSEQPERRAEIAPVEDPAPAPIEELAVEPVEVAVIEPPPPPRALKPPKKKRAPKIEPEIVAAPPPEPPPVEEPVPVEAEPPIEPPVETPPPVAIAPPATPEPRPLPQPAPLTAAERGKHELTAKKCGKCHTASYVFDGIAQGKTPITGQPFHAEEIKRQVVRCTRLPHSNITKEEAREILAHLVSAGKK